METWPTECITILTRRPGGLGSALHYGARRALGAARRLGMPCGGPPQRLDGPAAVRFGLVEGLGRIGQPYRLDPPVGRVTRRVGVLSDLDALRWAIEARRRGQIARLVAGPNLVVLPDDAEGLLLAGEVDVVVVASEWVRAKFEALAPALCGRVRVWPSGVDERRWRPSATPKATDCLLYVKACDPGLVEVVEAELQRRGLVIERLEYGAYTQAGYRAALARARWMLALSPSETQGLALFEAWASGVPTLVWDRGFWELRGRRWEPASSAPYLTPACGLRFADASGFPAALDSFLARLSEFQPRAFVLNGFTLAHSARAYAALLYEAGGSPASGI